MQQLINWRKWEDEKPDFNKSIIMIREGDEINIGSYFLCHNKSEWIQFDDGDCYSIDDIISIKYWCYLSELIPDTRTKYNSVEEFFTKPIKGWIDLEEHTEQVVELQKKVIDTATGFGEFILKNQITYYADEKSETLFDWNGSLFSSNELFCFYMQQLETETLNLDS